ncbi:MAG: hypothetical protein KTR35_16125 [Gammaproteobacteria bacterium]|nr:hypothetical protein [Gammaproteobacteria bacterium]
MKQPDNTVTGEVTLASPQRYFSAEHIILGIEADWCTTDDAPSNLTTPWRDAILLEEQAPLLTCLSQWFGQEFDWQPLENDLSPNSPDATLQSKAGPKRKLELTLTEGGVERLPEFPAEFQEFIELSLHHRTCQLVLDRLALNIEDQSRVGPGALVLLPKSFQPNWMVELAAVESLNTVVATAMLNANQAQLQPMEFYSELRQAESDSDPYSVVLLESLVVHKDQWSLDQSLSLTSTSTLVGLSVQFRHPKSQTLLAGTLCNVGSGMAVLIDNAELG